MRIRAIFLNDLLNLPQPIDLRLLYDAMDDAIRGRGRREVMAELVRRASARQPLMLVVEDLHWADESTLQYLAELTATVPECMAVLVMTSRIEGDPIDEAWRGAAQGSPLLTLDLGPLRRQEAIALAGGTIKVMPRLALACIERAEGNPLFLEQLLRVAEETAAATLPGSIQSLVLARVDQLDPLDKQALQAASILGQRFSLDALRRLLRNPGYTCAELIKHYLVRPEGDDFLFAHALLWEGVYASLLRARRRELHRQAAEWFAVGDPVRRRAPGARRGPWRAARLPRSSAWPSCRVPPRSGHGAGQPRPSPGDRPQRHLRPNLLAGQDAARPRLDRPVHRGLPPCPGVCGATTPSAARRGSASLPGCG